MLKLEDLKKLHDKAYNAHQITRERAADDLVFYWITQWDDNMLSESQLAYRGEFNVLRKAGRGILSDLASNPVAVDFEPVDESREDAADVIDGLYRADNHNNLSLEAREVAKQETVVCGFGAWILYQEYATMQDDDNNQVIRRRPINEANNTCYFDPNSTNLDKSDANYCSILTAYSEDGYKDLVKDLTDEELDTINADDFKSPEHSYTFPWIGGESKKIYVTEFYHREKVKDVALTMTNPVGQELTLRESELKDVMDEMLDTGFAIVSEKKITRWQVTKYIASGAKILNGDIDPETGERTGDVIAGQHIPVVPMYGEHAYIESEEHYEGITKLAKDPQRLRNFQLSYLADIVSRSPRQKPIFQQEQIAGFEDYYSVTGADNNFPYLLQNRMAPDGTPLPVGPIAVMPEQPVPSALIQSIALSKEAVEDVANPGVPQNVADPDLSGKAVLALQNRIDMQSQVYQEHAKHAERRDGEIYASMASELYDVPRTVMMVAQDGKRSKVQMMETVVDNETGDIVTLNDINNVEFQVYSTIGPSYTSMKEQTVDRLENMVQGLPPGDPIREILILKTLNLMDGVDFEDVRAYVDKQLLLKGIRQPETEEDAQILAEEAQKGQQPGADMVLAMAEDKKGQAQLLEAQIKQFTAQTNAQNNQAKQQIDGFNAQTKRMDTQIDAQEAGATINMKRVDTFGKQLDNQAKIIQLRQPADMADDELLKELMG